MNYFDWNSRQFLETLGTFGILDRYESTLAIELHRLHISGYVYFREKDLPFLAEIKHFRDIMNDTIEEEEQEAIFSQSIQTEVGSEG